MGELGRDGIASSQLVVGISVSAGDADAVGGVLRAQVDTSVGGILPLGELEVDAQLLGGIGDGVGEITDGSVPIQIFQVAEPHFLGGDSLGEVESMSGGGGGLPDAAAEGQGSEGCCRDNGGYQRQGDVVPPHTGKGQQSGGKETSFSLQTAQMGAAGGGGEIRGVRRVQKPHAGAFQHAAGEDRGGDRNEDQKSDDGETKATEGQAAAPAYEAVRHDAQRDSQAHGGNTRYQKFQGKLTGELLAIGSVDHEQAVDVGLGFHDRRHDPSYPHGGQDQPKSAAEDRKGNGSRLGQRDGIPHFGHGGAFVSAGQVFHQVEVVLLCQRIQTDEGLGGVGDEQSQRRGGHRQNPHGQQRIGDPPAIQHTLDRRNQS